MSSTSSTNNSLNHTPGIIQTSTSTNSEEYERILRDLEQQRNQTPAQIRASSEARVAEDKINLEKIKTVGEIKQKTVILYIIGIISIILVTFGCIIFVINEEISKDVWVIIGPIIMAGISGTIGFLTGEKINSK